MSRLRLAAALAPALALIPAACFVEVPSSRPAPAAGCPEDLGDCDDDGVCETDLETDKDHCGACGHGCLGASCVNARCQPIQLRSGQTYPHDIAVDDSHVFWTTGGGGNGSGTVMKLNKDGSAPRTLVDDGYKPRGIDVDDAYVYWADGGNGSLHRIPKTATGLGQDEVLVSGMAGETKGEGFVRRFGDRIFWSYEKAGTVRSVTLDGSDVTVHAAGQELPRQIALVDDMIYFTVGAPGIRRVPLVGGAVQILESADELSKFSFGMVAVGDTVVFRESNYGSGFDGRVTAYDPARDDFTVLVESSGARDITADATHLFWCSEDEQTLSRARHDGSELTVLATQQVDPTSVAVDDEALYWTNRALYAPAGGSVWMVAK